MRRIDLSTATWRKSSHSNPDGGECIEVSADFLRTATWRKSTHSNSDGGNCVEVTDDHPAVVPVRDSKDPQGPVLLFGPDAWSAFVGAVKRTEFSPPAA